MSGETCSLCKCAPAIENSHVIPAFVFRAIKGNSFTGFFRNPNDPNVRRQDGDKVPLLCKGCEGRFSVAEREFAKVFESFHTKDQDAFNYGDWMQYFLTSLAWRALTLDLPGIAEDATVPNRVVETLQQTVDKAAEYLLGATHLASLFKNHLIVFTKADSCSPDMAALGPNVMFRRSAFGYTLFNKASGHAAVVHNLAGMICVLIIKGNPQDKWEGTKIAYGGGDIKPPHNVSSWIIGDVLEMLMEAKKSQAEKLSERQQEKIVEAVKKNPTAPALKRHEEDQRLRSGGG